MNDVDYYKECLKANFFIYKNKILLSDLIKLPADSEFNEHLKKYKTYEIEKSYNHFHMTFISPDIKKQMQYAINIWKVWRLYFDKNFPKETIEIQISDDGKNIVLHVCRPWVV